MIVETSKFNFNQCCVLMLYRSTFMLRVLFLLAMHVTLNDVHLTI